MIPVAVLYSVVLGIWFRFARNSSSLLFYLLFAIAITASVQLVGIYLVFATLILPALVIQILNQSAIVWGYLIGLTGYGLGLIIAAVFDMPAGAMIVVTLVVTSLSTGLLFSKKRVDI